MAFDDLYQEIILDHYRNPRNAAKLDDVPDEMVHERTPSRSRCTWTTRA
jgi:NifU-like protein involved in Fe-S cluster formation